MNNNSKMLVPTPGQIEGPYFPVAFLGDEDNLLVKNAQVTNILKISGVVRDTHGNPISDVRIIIWQADSSGRYNHPDDVYLGSLDPNFKYWGQCVTDASGRYFFLTVKPGPYRDKDASRTPHIHFKVYRQGNELSLTTQMYFPEEILNETDEHLQSLPSSLHHLLIATVIDELQATFDITI